MTDQVELTARDWALRATACELLAYSLRYPNAEVMDVFVSGEWAEAAVELGETLGLSPEDVACPDLPRRQRLWARRSFCVLCALRRLACS